MSIISSRDRKKALSQASLMLLKWLENLPEYNRFYKRWRRQIEQGKVLEYEIKKIKLAKGVIYKVIIRPENLTHDGHPDWISRTWVKEETRRLEKRANGDMYLRQEFWRKKLGFYPLINPETGENLFPVLRHIKQKYAKGFFLPAVKVLNYPMNVIKIKYEIFKKSFGASDRPPLPPLPSKLKIEVNYRESIDLITDEIEKIIRVVKKEHHISQRRWQVNPELKFKASFLKRIGLTRKMIMKRLMLPMDNPDQKDAFRKRLNRILDQLFKTPA